MYIKSQEHQQLYNRMTRRTNATTYRVLSEKLCQNAWDLTLECWLRLNYGNEPKHTVKKSLKWLQDKSLVGKNKLHWGVRSLHNCNYLYVLLILLYALSFTTPTAITKSELLLAVQCFSFHSCWKKCSRHEWKKKHKLMLSSFLSSRHTLCIMWFWKLFENQIIKATQPQTKQKI